MPAEVLSAALFTRFRSRQKHTFAEKIISAMRKGFGGHVEPKKGIISPPRKCGEGNQTFPASQPMIACLRARPQW